LAVSAGGHRKAGEEEEGLGLAPVLVLEGLYGGVVEFEAATEVQGTARVSQMQQQFPLSKNTRRRPPATTTMKSKQSSASIVAASLK
jgi:hypothetical protein